MTKRNQLGVLLIIFNLLVLGGIIKYGMVKFYDIEVGMVAVEQPFEEEDLTPIKQSWKNEYQMVLNHKVVTYDDVIGKRINKYNSLIEQHAKELNIDPNLLRSLIRQESMGDPYAQSYTGVLGLTQLTELTAREVGITNRADAEQSIIGGVRYMDKLIKRFQGNVILASIAYNTGSTYVWRAIKLSGPEANTTDILLSLEKVMDEKGKQEKWKRETLPHLTNVWTHYIKLTEMTTI